MASSTKSEPAVPSEPRSSQRTEKTAFSSKNLASRNDFLNSVKTCASSYHSLDQGFEPISLSKAISDPNANSQANQQQELMGDSVQSVTDSFKSLKDIWKSFNKDRYSIDEKMNEEVLISSDSELLNSQLSWWFWWDPQWPTNEWSLSKNLLVKKNALVSQISSQDGEQITVFFWCKCNYRSPFSSCLCMFTNNVPQTFTFSGNLCQYEARSSNFIYNVYLC